MSDKRDKLNEALSCFGGLGPQSGIQLAYINKVAIIRTTKHLIVDQIREKVKDFGIEVRPVIRIE